MNRTKRSREIRRVILISIDNLRADCVSANPNLGALSAVDLANPPRTPNLDSLIADGAWFTRCFSGAPYTTASHATMLTGLFPPRHGIREYFRTPLRQDALTLFQRFKSSGWRTVLATDFPALLGPTLGFTRDVDQYIEESDEATLAQINHSSGEPLFCFWHFGTVHNPFGLTSLMTDGPRFEAETARVASMADVPPPASLGPEWMEKQRDHRERLLRQWYSAATDKMYKEKRYDELMTLYVDGVNSFDAGRLARVLRQLRDLMSDSDLLIVTADHGEEYSDRAFAHFNGLWDGIVNVPLIIYGGGIAPGTRVEQLCRSADIAPTILECVSEVDADLSVLDGVSLLPAMSGAPMELVAFGETMFGYSGKIQSFLAESFAAGFLADAPVMASTHLLYARDDRWKLVLHRDLEARCETACLYDTIGDPLEKVDRSSEYPEIMNLLRRTIDRHSALPAAADREREIEAPRFSASTESASQATIVEAQR